MNKHILLVMKWLNNKDSVSQEELKKNRREAWTHYASADYDFTGGYHAAYYAVSWAYSAANVSYWVNRYFEITGEDRNEYLKELEK